METIIGDYIGTTTGIHSGLGFRVFFGSGVHRVWRTQGFGLLGC